MPHYKVIFVGEQKVKSTDWRNRDDAAKQIVERGLSVVSVYECVKGRHYFDVSDKIAEKIKADHEPSSIADNVALFLLRAAT
jgi:hypothetical protein